MFIDLFILCCKTPRCFQWRCYIIIHIAFGCGLMKQSL